MKKAITVIFAMTMTMLLGSTSCFAAILPSRGPGQIGYSSVVLCDSLSLHSDRDYASSVVQTLRHGDNIIVMKQEEGWANVATGDAVDSPVGWVDASYIAIDPTWYRTEGSTAVYAWDDTSAPKVALLDEGTTLPILRDDGNWILVSLRGAAGWICNPVRTQSNNYNDASNSNSNTSTNTNSYTPDNSWSGSGSGASDNDLGEAQADWFTVYARDGSTVSIHAAGGSMYEDARGRTYVKQDDDGYYYCITTDTTYAFDPGVWTGEAYGENEFPSEENYTGADYGETSY